MAIDMIENNELGALASSRLGMKQFADEQYKNYTGGEDFFSILGSRTQRKEGIRTEVRSKYVDLPTDCDNIQKSIDIVSADIEVLLKRKQNLRQRESLNEANFFLGELKKKQIQQDCQAILAKRKADAERAATIETLTKLGDVSVGKAQAELAGLRTGDEKAAGGLDTKKLLIYGGVGVAVLIGIALILRR